MSMKPKKLPDHIREYFVEMGAEGGRIGGRLRAAKLTPERRSEIARKANAARQAKRNEKPA